MHLVGDQGATDSPQSYPCPGDEGGDVFPGEHEQRDAWTGLNLGVWEADDAY